MAIHDESTGRRADVLAPAAPTDLVGFVDYVDGGIVSRTLLQKPSGSLTMFAFDAGQGLSEHAAPYDATVFVVDGEADVVIGGERHQVRAGEVILMPANVPHALDAQVPFKMLLIMIRAEPGSSE